MYIHTATACKYMYIHTANACKYMYIHTANACKHMYILYVQYSILVFQQREYIHISKRKYCLNTFINFCSMTSLRNAATLTFLGVAASWCLEELLLLEIFKTILRLTSHCGFSKLHRFLNSCSLEKGKFLNVN